MIGTPCLTILMTTDAVGGVWQYSTDVTAELARRGHRVTLAVLGPSPDDGQRRAAQGHVRLVETGLPLDWLCSDPAPVEAAAHEIARRAETLGAHIVHCNMPTLAGAAEFPCPVLAVTHGCVATWWQAARQEPLTASYRWHRKMMGDGLAAADAVVAPSASYAATVRRTYGLPRAPLVVHNGRPAAMQTSRGPAINAAVTVGRLWDSVKNAALLDRVAARIDLPFLAAGALRGPHGEEIALSGIQALGQISSREIEVLLRLRPIFVSAATFEPFGLAVLEAASAGCPLILSDIPTFRELWDGVALFVDPLDEDGFTTAIESLSADPARRLELGQSAARRAASYTPAATADGIEAVYAGLLARQEVAA